MPRIPPRPLWAVNDPSNLSFRKGKKKKKKIEMGVCPNWKFLWWVWLGCVEFKMYIIYGLDTTFMNIFSFIYHEVKLRRPILEECFWHQNHSLKEVVCPFSFHWHRPFFNLSSLCDDRLYGWKLSCWGWFPNLWSSPTYWNLPDYLFWPYGVY